MAYREIVTKAVIGKGRKTYKNEYKITVPEPPSTVLGCWIINHTFQGREVDNKIVIDGSFDANVWYSYDHDTKTNVISQKITYTEEEKMDVSNEGTNKDIIIRSLKQPTCISAKEDGNTINLEVEKELGIEIVGDTIVKVSSIDEDDEWIDLDNKEINPNYISPEIKK